MSAMFSEETATAGARFIRRPLRACAAMIAVVSAASSSFLGCARPTPAASSPVDAPPGEPQAPASSPASMESPPSQPFEEKIFLVVRAHDKEIQHTCWQAALDAAPVNTAPGDASKQPEVRIKVSLIIERNGQVQQVITTGGESTFPGLSSCISGQVRGWRFPQRDGRTPVNIPYVFGAR